MNRLNRLRLWLSAWLIHTGWRVAPRMTPEAAESLKGTTYHNSSTGELRYWTGEEWLPVTQSIQGVNERPLPKQAP